MFNDALSVILMHFLRFGTGIRSTLIAHLYLKTININAVDYKSCFE